MTVAAASVPSWSWYSNTKVGRDTPILDLLDRPIRRICFSGCPFPLQDWRRYSHQLCVIAIVEASSMTKKHKKVKRLQKLPLMRWGMRTNITEQREQMRPRPKVEGMVHLPAPPYIYKVVWYWQLDPSNEKTGCVCEVQRGVLVMFW